MINIVWTTYDFASNAINHSPFVNDHINKKLISTMISNNNDDHSEKYIFETSIYFIKNNLIIKMI